ncbi:hypothetical protein SLEP1_g54125 [Rubroshorea leprosula]|uniref:Uncharacterized protein n=1 Tax=Rubroshorea leprosula TaxID=152421 RepID=A0AAV5MCK1_9ROSI|nr:hypothetical protein SLEP1_g54125 [Rubroshorea leprosula]
MAMEIHLISGDSLSPTSLQIWSPAAVTLRRLQLRSGDLDDL